MLFVFIQVRQGIEVCDNAVDPGPNKSLGTQLAEQVQVFTLTGFYDGCQQQHAGALWYLHHLVNHLADGLGLKANTVLRTMGFADPGKQQAQVVINFGDGAHCRTWVVVGGFLLDGNRR